MLDRKAQMERKETICYHCSEKGPYAKTCPKKKNEDEQVHTNINEGWEYDDGDGMEYMYHKTDKNQKWDERILTDSQSTIDQFKDKMYLIDIHTATIQVTKRGMFGDIPIWYHPEGSKHSIPQDPEGVISHDI